jgi:hypothetical protein
MWRSITIAMAVAGVVLLGVLYAIGDWGACCGPGLAKPITGDSTWARPPNPWTFGQAPAPTEKAHHHAKADEGASGENASPVGVLAALKPHVNRSHPSLPEGPSPTEETTPLPPSGGPSPGSPTNNCSPVVDVLTGLGLADCAQEAGGSNHNDSSGNHDSSGNGNHHSPNQGGSSDNASGDATVLANGLAAANDNSNGSDNGNHNGSDKGKKDHGASSQSKSHGNGRSHH